MSWRKKIFSPYINFGLACGLATACFSAVPVSAQQGSTALYVSNGVGSSIVSVVDTNLQSIVGSIDVGTNPGFMALAGTGMYVSTTSQISVFDISTRASIISMPLPSAHTMALAGSHMYVLQSASSNVSIIDTTNPGAAPVTISVGSTPVSLALVGTGMYVANNTNNNISIIDVFHPLNPPSVISGVPNPQALALAGTGMYVTSALNQSVQVIDVTTQQPTQIIAVPPLPTTFYPHALAVAGTGMYVSNESGNLPGICIIDTNTKQIVKLLDDGGIESHFLGLNGTAMYVEVTNPPSVAVIDTTSQLLVDNIGGLGIPSGLAFGVPFFTSSQIVDISGDTNTPGTLRYAINQLSGREGTINFSPSLTPITLTSNLPPLAGNITINYDGGPNVTVDGAGQYQALFAQAGNIDVYNLTIQNAAAVGGFGGAGPTTSSGGYECGGGGGGGGGAGLGGGLFVNQGATVIAKNIIFTGNKALGGTGGAGASPAYYVLDLNFDGGGGGGGGGGCNYGAQACGGTGGLGYPRDYFYGGGGGGGGGNTIGAIGLNASSNDGGTGGNGGGILGGAGGAADGGAGGAGLTAFSGGGGGGGEKTLPGSGCGGQGGAGADFGGGGGAGVSDAISQGACSLPSCLGGLGGFGGGGGGGAEMRRVAISNPLLLSGGTGGFGGGGGGGIPSVGSLYAGGHCINSGVGGVDGGGGAGLGGAVFVRQGGSLVLEYDTVGSPPFLNNSVTGGAGGGPNATPGATYGSDIFLNSGGALTFKVNTPITVFNSIASDALVPGLGIIVKGSNTLTLSGANTYDGGTQILDGGHLIVSLDNNLGSIPGTVTFNSGALEIPSPGFHTSRNFVLGAAGATVAADSMARLNLLGVLSGPGQVLFNGLGRVTLSGINSAFPGSMFFDSGTVQISSVNNLPTTPLTFGAYATGGTLEFLAIASIPNDITLNTYGGTISTSASSITAATLSGNLSGPGHLTITGPGITVLSGHNNSLVGGITISSGSTLNITNYDSIPTGYPVSIGSGGLLNFFNTNTAQPGIISGLGSIAMESAGLLALEPVGPGGNTYSGNTTISSGTIQISGVTPLGTSTVLLGSGILEFVSTTSISNLITLNATMGTIQSDGGVVATLSGSLSGSGSSGVLFYGSGTVLLSGTNSGCSSQMLFDSSTVQISSVSNLTTGPLSFGTHSPNGTLEFLAFTSIPNSITLNTNGGTILTHGSGVTATLSGPVTGVGALTITGLGTTVLNVITGSTNTYSGETTISPGATLNINTAASIPWGGTVNIGLGGSLNFLQTDWAQPGIISGAGTVTMQGSGVLGLVGGNSYSGNTTISSGTIQIATGTPFGSGDLIFEGGRLEIGESTSFSFPIVFGTPGGTIANGIDIVTTLSGDLSGSGPVCFEGSITQLSSVNNRTLCSSSMFLDTVILQISSASNLPTGSLSFGTNDTGGTLEFLASASIPNSVTLNTYGGTILSDSGATLTGPLIGIGALTIAGSGTTILTGHNSYSGTTTINSGSTLQISTYVHALSPQSIHVQNNGSLQFNNFSGTVSNLISGSGSLSMLTVGPLTLTGSNDYSGGTNICAGGTLNISNYNSIPPGGSVNVGLGGSLNFLNNTSTAQPGIISGNGSITMGGAGILSLGVGNSYHGTTTISSGIVQISDGTSLNSSSGVTLENATLSLFSTLSAPLPLSVPISLIGPGATLDCYQNWTYSGTISSTTNEQLTLARGSGLLSFSGSNTSTGLSTLLSGAYVNLSGSFSGPVTVNQGATLEGTGSAGTTINAGVVNPVQQMNVTGDYTQTGTGELKINIKGNRTCDLLNITGSVTLNGTLTVDASQGSYLPGQTYTILNSVAKVDLSGQFSATNFPSFLNLSIQYNNDPSVVLTVLGQSILAGAHVFRHNPLQVLENLREIIHTPNSDLINVLHAMADFNSNELTGALDQLHPAPFGAFDLLNAATNSMLTSIFARHPAETCCMHLKSGCACPNTSAWLHPFGYFYDQNRIGEQFGFYSQTAGLAGGMNYCFLNGILVGLGGAYHYSDLRWNHNHGDGWMQAGSLAVYADYAKDSVSLEASLIGSLDQFHATRTIHFSTIHRHAKHTSNGYEVTAHLGGSRDIKAAYFYLKPFASFDYFYLNQNSFSEKGAQSLNLHVHDYDSNMLRSEMGLRLTHSYAGDEGQCFSPTIWLSGINECHLVKKHYTAHFAEEIPTFKVRTFNKPIYLLSPGVDLTLKLAPNFSLSARYSAELNTYIANQKVDGRLEWLF